MGAARSDRPFAVTLALVVIASAFLAGACNDDPSPTSPTVAPNTTLAPTPTPEASPTVTPTPEPTGLRRQFGFTPEPGGDGAIRIFPGGNVLVNMCKAQGLSHTVIWGDGATFVGEDCRPQHAYVAAGTYTLVATVSDQGFVASQAEISDTLTVVVDDPKGLAVSKNGTGSGTVTSNPAGIDCGASCQADFGLGQVVGLTATPDAGSGFTGWDGACSGTGTCTVSMDAAATVTATFTLGVHSLNVSKSGTGSGTVSGSGIDCGGDCGESYDYGTDVSLTATPTDGHSTFTGWSGACSGTGACNVTMDADKAVDAEFSLDTHTLTISKSGAGTGLVEGTGISCGATCEKTFDHGDVAELSQTADGGSIFTGWGGDCSGSGACNPTMDADRSVDATFELGRSFSITKRDKVGSTTDHTVEGIVVSGFGPDFTCGSGCGPTVTHTYADGTMLELTAENDSGNSTFTMWQPGSLCDEGGNGTICTTTLTSDGNLTVYLVSP